MAKKILDELGCTYSEKQSGLFLWAKAPHHVSDVEKWIDEVLYATKVFITPGFIFGDSGKQHIRISLCAPVEKMEQALQRIREWRSRNGHSTSKTKAKSAV